MAKPVHAINLSISLFRDVTHTRPGSHSTGVFITLNLKNMFAGILWWYKVQLSHNSGTVTEYVEVTIWNWNFYCISTTCVDLQITGVTAGT